MAPRSMLFVAVVAVAVVVAVVVVVVVVDVVVDVVGVETHFLLYQDHCHLLN